MEKVFALSLVLNVLIVSFILGNNLRSCPPLLEQPQSLGFVLLFFFAGLTMLGLGQGCGGDPVNLALPGGSSPSHPSCHSVCLHVSIPSSSWPVSPPSPSPHMLSDRPHLRLPAIPCFLHTGWNTAAMNPGLSQMYDTHYKRQGSLVRGWEERDLGSNMLGNAACYEEDPWSITEHIGKLKALRRPAVPKPVEFCCIQRFLNISTLPSATRS